MFTFLNFYSIIISYYLKGKTLTMNDLLTFLSKSANEKTLKQEININGDFHYFDGNSVSKSRNEMTQHAKVKTIANNIELAQQQIKDLEKSIKDMNKLLYLSIETPKMKYYKRKVIECATVNGVELWHGSLYKNDDDKFYFTVPSLSGIKSATSLHQAINDIYEYGHHDCAKVINDVYTHGFNVISVE